MDFEKLSNLHSKKKDDPKFGNILNHPTAENICQVKPLTSLELIEKEIPAKKILL